MEKPTADYSRFFHVRCPAVRSTYFYFYLYNQYSLKRKTFCKIALSLQYQEDARIL